MVNVNVEAVCLAWVNVVPKSELLGEVAALALGAVADVGHVLTFRCLGSSRRFDGLKRVSGTLTHLRDFRRLEGPLEFLDVELPVRVLPLLPVNELLSFVQSMKIGKKGPVSQVVLVRPKH